MRSAPHDSGKMPSRWRAVPEGLRINWGDCDPNQPMPASAIVTLARAGVERFAGSVSALAVLSGVMEAVLFDKFRSLSSRLGRVLSRRHDDADGHDQRFSIVLLFQRNMVHVEFKLARP